MQLSLVYRYTFLAPSEIFVMKLNYEETRVYVNFDQGHFCEAAQSEDFVT